MHLAGTQSWRMVCDEPRLLMLALYVRDAADPDAAAWRRDLAPVVAELA